MDMVLELFYLWLTIVKQYIRFINFIRLLLKATLPPAIYLKKQVIPFLDTLNLG